MKKHLFCICLLLVSFIGFTQKKAIKKFSTSAKVINISTEGLDDLTIENSDSEFVEIFLYAENPKKQHIVLEEKKTETNVSFKFSNFKNEDKIFRKYITKRLKRARSIIKIPENKSISIFGEETAVFSKSYKGNLRVFLENGTVKLDTIQQNLELKIYAGNVYGTVKKTNLKLISKFGKIKVDTIFHQKKYDKKEVLATREISISTIKGNIFLRHQKR